MIDGFEADEADAGRWVVAAATDRWPLVAEGAGFSEPRQRPVFLTLETAQYYMDVVLDSYLVEERYFDGVTVRRNRLASQILDNLNKAAVVGFPYGEISERLRAAWTEDNVSSYDQAQQVATAFREHCLRHNLVDFSLQIELLSEHVLALPQGQAHVMRFQHLIADNVEEDVPVAHDLVRDWVGRCQSALLVYDRDAGYRAFLGADPRSGLALRAACRRAFVFSDNIVSSGDVGELGRQLAPGFRPKADQVRERRDPASGEPGGDVRRALHYAFHRFHPQMLGWVADRVSHLVSQEGIRPGEIAVLAPYLSDALRFTIGAQLERFNIPTTSHRPSRSLREEMGARCLLTLAALAHPQWGIVPSRFDIAQMLVQAIDDMDLVRAHLLTEIVYRTGADGPMLTSFAAIEPGMQDRITFVLGGRYDELQRWLGEYRARGQPLLLDLFFADVFSELLSLAGFGFHDDLDAAATAANVIESVAKFRLALGSELTDDVLGRDYLRMVDRGVVAAQYISSWRQPTEDAVLLAPAYTFLMRNRPVDYQFWLEVGSTGWWERPYQPLTHPYVLTRHWPEGAVWTDSDEVDAKRDSMERLLLGLTRRCRKGIYLGISEMGESGYDQRGPLLESIQRILKRVAQEDALDGR